MRDFVEVITDLDDGKVNERGTKVLAELVAAVMETGKKGSLVLKLSVSKQGVMALVKADLSARKPEPAVETSIFWATADGELRREDPRQLKLRTVADSATVTPLKTAAATKGEE